MNRLQELVDDFNKYVEQKRKQVFISSKGNKVIATHIGTGKQAIARCHPDDEFDFMTGAKLALERLDEMLNPPLYYVKLTDGDRYGYLNIHTKYSFTVASDKKGNNIYKTKFTLDEIKAINPNYLPFAVRVEGDE